MTCIFQFLVVHRNAVDFCILSCILQSCWTHLLVLVALKIDYMRFSAHSCHLKIKLFTSLLFTFSLSPSCLISLTKTSTSMLNRRNNRRYTCCCCCSVTQVCLTLCDPMDYSMPGFPILHHLLELAQIHVHWVGDAIQPSHPLSSLLLLPSILPRIGSFLMSQLFASGGQSSGVSASSSSVLPMNI